MRSAVVVFFRLSVTVGIFAFLLNKVEVDVLSENLRRVSYPSVVGVIFLFFVQIALSVLRWQLILKSLYINMSFVKLLAYWMEGAFFNQALPSVVGGDAFRIWRMKQAGSDLAKASAGVLLDRVFALKALLLIVLLTLPGLYTLAVGDELTRGLLILAVLGIAGLLLLAVLYKIWVNSDIKSRFENIANLFDELRTIYRKPGESLLVIGLSFLIHGLSVLEIYTIGFGYGMEIGLIDCFIVIPSVLLIQIVPISIAGWGIRDGAMVTGFGWANVAPENAITLSLTYGVFVLLTSLPGIAVWLTYRKSKVN